MAQGAAILLSILLVGAFPVSCAAADAPPLGEYFRAETARIAGRPLLGISQPSDWMNARPRLQRELKEMLGLWPTPQRGDLRARVTATVERPEFVIEKILYESVPGLFVTGNLYRPREANGRLPAILYVCGHSKVEKDGLIIGNKAHYQHHPAWFAANGYVCLVIDTLQLGELPGLHHGTAREGKWWWQSRGYTPAGVEAWNGVRAIDYLVSRADVDAKKIGVTGRSGGGATSWWLGAIDDRIAAVAPVAGITDLQNHVVDGVVQGHCDCMYIVNTYRWDYDTLAALVAPKPLLVENTNEDPIFPEDGVRRIYRQLERVYAWHGAADRLGLVIGQGGHADTTELRHPAFAFFEKWLKGKSESAITEPDRSVPIEELKVLKPGEIPAGNKNDTIHESFVAKAVSPAPPRTSRDKHDMEAKWSEDLARRVFGGWPDAEVGAALDEKIAVDVEVGGLRARRINFDSQPGVRLSAWLFTTQRGEPARELAVEIGDEVNWKAKWRWLEADGGGGGGGGGALGRAGDLGAAVRNQTSRGVARMIVFPRGVGPTAWPAEKDIHVRRRFALLGQTLAGMQVWDVRRALALARALQDTKGAKVELVAAGPSAALAIWVAVHEPEVSSLVLTNPPRSVREGPAFQNLERVLEMPQALAMLYPRRVTLVDADADAWRWARDAAKSLDPTGEPWPKVVRVRD
jgi:dienelactone hydrolase